MEKIPVTYKGEAIGYTYNDQDKIKMGHIVVENKELWDKIVANNSQTIGISSRAIGEVDVEGHVIKEEKTSYDIQSLTKEDQFEQDKDSRNWNRYFPKDELVMLDINWMDDYDKEPFSDLIGEVGTVVECVSDLHAFGRGSSYQHHIKWSNGTITGEIGKWQQVGWKPSPNPSILEYAHIIKER